MRTRSTRGLGALFVVVAMLFTGMVTGTVALSAPAAAANPCDGPNPPETCDPPDPIDPCDLNPSRPGCTDPEPCVITIGTAPSIVGTVRVGTTLSADKGAWTGADSYGYRWLVDGAQVGTGPEYIPQPVHLGKSLTLEVTASAACGAARIATTGPETVALGEQIGTNPIQKLEGALAPTVGVRLHVIEGGTKGIGTPTVTFAWYVDRVLVGHGADYTPQPADVGKRISVVGHYDRVGYATYTISNVVVRAIQPGAAPAASRAPGVTGGARYGGTLRVTPGAWSLPGQVSHQWLRDGTPIAGATGTSYRPGLADIGRVIAVRETNAPAGHESAAATSVSVRVALAGKLAHKVGKKKPALKGKHTVGKVLQVRPAKKKLRGWFAPAASQVRFQWLRDGRVIKKATKAKYRLRKADRRHKVSVLVIAVRPGYADGAWKSKAVRVR